MLKILQARLQQGVNPELPDVQAEIRKSRGTRDQITNIHWIIEKQKNSRKTSASASLITWKFLTVWITTNWKISKEMGITAHLTCLLRNLYVGQEITNPDMEQWAGSKLGKEYDKAVYCHLAYLTYIQSYAE